MPAGSLCEMTGCKADLRAHHQDCEMVLNVQLERAMELSADMQRRGVQRNVHTHSALMNVCIKCGQLKLALDVWEEMQRDGIVPNVVCLLLHRKISAPVLIRF